MSYSLDSLTDDCYPGTTCLINKFNIRQERQLAVIESGITTLKEAELLECPLPGTFDFEHYKAIHRYLFEDIYDWAGEVRTVDIAKKDTRFVKAAEIEEVAARAFSRLNRCNNFKGLPFKEFIEDVVDFYCVTNMLHPFREGNGRTQRAFFTQLIRNAGYDINFSEVDADELMIATIHSAGGVRDHLYSIFYSAIHLPE